MSVIDYVDKIVIYDTGSTDKTILIIQEIIKLKGNKVIFKQIGPVDKQTFPKVRQDMLDQSNCDWLMILDGDEVWPKESISAVIKKIQTEGDSIDAIIVPFYVCLGDIYHYQSESAGKYQIGARCGHISVRFINRRIKGLHVNLPYGKEGFYNESGQVVQELDHVDFNNAPYFHLTHLIRSSKVNSPKYKVELGNKFDQTFVYPEVFNLARPEDVEDPFMKRSVLYTILSLLFEGLYIIKRKAQRYAKH